MNVSEKEIIIGLQDAATSKALVQDLKQDLKAELFSLKESIRYDVQNIVNGSVKLMVKEALDEHYDTKARPHIEAVSARVDKTDGRVSTLESDKKAVKWVVLALTGIANTIYSVFNKYI